MSGKTFAGNLRIAPVNVSGVKTGGYSDILNSVKCNLVTPAPTNIDQISRQKGTAGQLLSRAQVAKATTLQIEIDDTRNQRVMAYALNGVTAAYSQTGGTIADEVVVAPAVLDEWVSLANIHVSSVVVNNSADSTVYTLGTDYLVDATMGLLKILSTGTITASQSLKVDYTAAAVTGTTVRGSLVASTLLRVVVDLGDLVDGSNGIFICPIFQASSSGNNDLLGNKMLIAALDGAMFIPPAGSAAATETGGAPYILTTLD